MDGYEIFGTFSALGLLLELGYVHVFASDPAGLDRVMDELIRLTATASRKVEAISDDDAAELQLRITLYLRRFQESVHDRIRSGRTV